MLYFDSCTVYVQLDLLDANFTVDGLTGQLLLPVSQLLKYKPGNNGRELGDNSEDILVTLQKKDTVQDDCSKIQYWVFVGLAVWVHHLPLLYPERERDTRKSLFHC